MYLNQFHKKQNWFRQAKTIQEAGTWLSEKNYSQPDPKQTRTFKYNQIIQLTAGLEWGRKKALKES